MPAAGPWLRSSTRVATPAVRSAEIVAETVPGATWWLRSASDDAGVEHDRVVGQLVGELAPGAGVEQQRRGEARGVGGEHLADEDGVVAAGVGVDDRQSTQPSASASTGDAGLGGAEVEPVEPLVHLAAEHAGEALAELGLVLAEDVDGEDAGGVDEVVRRDRAGQADRDQRRVEAHAGERRRGHAVPAGREVALVLLLRPHRRDHGDAAGPLAQHGAEGVGIDPHGTSRVSCSW